MRDKDEIIFTSRAKKHAERKQSICKLKHRRALFFKEYKSNSHVPKKRRKEQKVYKQLDKPTTNTKGNEKIEFESTVIEVSCSKNLAQILNKISFSIL